MADKPNRVTESVVELSARWQEAKRPFDEVPPSIQNMQNIRVVEAGDALLEALTIRSRPGEDAVEPAAWRYELARAIDHSTTPPTWLVICRMAMG